MQNGGNDRRAAEQRKPPHYAVYQFGMYHSHSYVSSYWFVVLWEVVGTW
jgi:hypothetical protein